MPNYEVVKMDITLARGEPMGVGRNTELVLDPRDLQVLNLLEYDNKEIEDRLGLPEHKVKNSIADIYRMLGVDDKTQAVIRGVDRGLIALETKFPPDFDLSALQKLNPGERRVAERVAALGDSKSTAIAKDLSLTPHTVKNHFTSIFSKLEIPNKTHLALLYLEAKRRARERLGPDREIAQDEIFGAYTGPKDKEPRRSSTPTQTTPRTRRRSTRTPNPVGTSKSAERSGFLRNGRWAGIGGNEMDHRASIAVPIDDLRPPEKTHDGDVYPQTVSSPLARLPYAMFMRRDGEPRYPTARAAVESLNSSHLEKDQIGHPLSNIARADKVESLLAGSRMQLDRYFIPAVEAHREYFDRPTHLLAEKTPPAVKNFFEWVRKHYGDTLTFDQMVARLKGGPLEYALPPVASSQSTTVYEA